MSWPKGISGNPRGRPRSSIRHALREAAGQKLPDGRTNAQAVAAKALELATDGNLDAIKFLTEQIDGKVPDALQVSGPDGRPVEVRTVTAEIPPEPTEESA